MRHRLATLAVSLIAALGTGAAVTAGTAHATTPRPHPGSHAGTADRASSSAAFTRPDISATGIAIQQTTSYEGTVCLDSANKAMILFTSCPPFSATQVWTKQPSTNGQYKIVQGTTCLDFKYGLAPCQQGDGYQKFNLALLSDGFEWKIEQPTGLGTACLTTNEYTNGFELCKKGDGAQKFTFPAAP